MWKPGPLLPDVWGTGAVATDLYPHERGHWLVEFTGENAVIVENGFHAGCIIPAKDIVTYYVIPTRP